MMGLALTLLLTATPEESLALAKKKFAALDYDQVIAALKPVLDDPAVDPELKAEAWVLEGSTRAIIQDLVDAEQPFRKLLRLKPDFELPAKTAPKILAAFRKVQAEEKAFAAETRQAERARIIAGLRLLDLPPDAAKGGRPVPFALRLFDPNGAVAELVVPYRKAGEPTYSTLALVRDETGTWRGALPGEVTVNDQGLRLEYFVETRDPKGARLLTKGTEGQPLLLEVSPGQLKRAALPRGFFYGATGAALASGVALGVVGGLFLQAQDAYTHPGGLFVPAPEHNALGARGDALGLGAAGLIVSTSVLAATALVMAFFVDW